MTTMDVAMPGTRGCGEIASKPHVCEDRPARQMPVCPVCREFTRDPELCEHRMPEPPPWPANTIRVPVPAEPVDRDVVWLHRQTVLAADMATIGGEQR